MKQKLLLMLALWLAFATGLQAQSNGLHFDGTDDYVDLPDFTTTYDFSQGFSFSAWLKWNALTGNARVFEIGNGSSSVNNSIILRINGSGILTLQCSNGTTNKEIVTDAAVVTTGKWYHVTATISSSGVATIYINGTSVKSGTVSVPVNILRANNWLGKSAWPTDAYFSGTMDEVSVWHKALSQTEINSVLKNGITGAEAKLTAHYKFDQGTVGGSNSGVTSLSDKTANALNGTLTNFALTGSTSNWVNGYNTPTGSNALYFDGTNDYVSCPAINPAQFTAEAWVYPTTLGKDQAILSTLNASSLVGMELHLGTDNIPIITVRNGSNFTDVKGTTAVTANTWTHIAATCNGTTVNLYVNGTLVKYTTIASYTAGTQSLVLGRRSGESGYYFSGKIDEARVWSTARSQAEIASTRNIPLAGTETDLLACYKFDQGSANSPNIGLSALWDATDNNNHGTLNNFTLAGTSSNWSSGYTPEPTITFISENSGNLYFRVMVLSDCTVYVDWGNGILVPFNASTSLSTFSTATYTSGKTVKVYGENIKYASIYDINVTALDVSNCTTLQSLSCSINKLKSLDISKNTALTSLFCFNNQFTFATLPLPKFSTYMYAPQANIAATHTNGVVDLSAHRTAIDKDGNTQTTQYKWYKTNGTALTVNVDYLEENGVFTFLTIPSSTVYCTMANAAFPDFKDADILRTEDMTIDAAIGLTFSFVSEKTGTLGFKAANDMGTGKVYVNWERNNMVKYTVNEFRSVLSFPTYTAGDTVKVYGKINLLDIVNKGITALDVSKWTYLTELYCDENKLDTLDVSKNLGLRDFYCSNNNLNSLDLSLIPNLRDLDCSNNRLKSLKVSNSAPFNYALECIGNQLTFATLPKPRATCVSYNYTGQANMPATCTKGVVDLGSQLIALDKNDIAQTTVYKWYTTDNTLLVAGTDYFEDGGEFKFVKKPALAVYCSMTNAAFPDLTLRTVDITVDAVAEPNFIFVSENTGTVSFKVHQTSGTKVFVDWGDGNYIQHETLAETDLSTTTYSASAPVKVYGKAISSLTISGQGLASLEVNDNTALSSIDCSNNNLATLDLSKVLVEAVKCENNKFTIKSLSDLGASYPGGYTYAPQANLPATCTNGVVDLSSQLTAVDESGNTQATSYQIFESDGSAFSEAFYMVINGKIYFLALPDPATTAVYCTMTNPAFPLLTLRTEDFTVDAAVTLPEPAITFTSENVGAISFTLACADNSTNRIYIDWGDGVIVPGTFTNPAVIATSSYVANAMVKVYAHGISQLGFVNKGLNSLDVSKCPTLTKLDCSQNKLTTINVSQNPALVWFDCGYNNLSSLNVENNLGLDYLGCYENKNLSELNISYNTELTFLDASACNLSSLNVGKNTKLTDLHLVDNKIGNIDISQNTQLSILSLEKNLLSFANLPQRKAPYINNYWYLPQAQLTPTITNGIVDLSSQLTAIDKDGNPQTTVYTWFDAYGNELEKDEVYFEKDGRFYFVFSFDKIYCKMTNAAFPTNSAADTFRTTDIDVVDIFPLSVSLTTKNPGSFTFSVSATENTTILVRKNTDDFTAYEISTTTSTLAVDISNEGSSITIYGEHIVDLDISGQKIDFLYSTNSFHSFNCSNNLLDFKSLPIPFSENNLFAPQTKIAATCTNGVVDLKRQRVAFDENYNSIYTVYTWYKTDGTALTANVDYIEERGVFTFIKMPDTDVYCSMTNAVFPDFTGKNALCTENITIDAVQKPNICFVSENSGDLSFTIGGVPTDVNYYVDWGNGNIVSLYTGYSGEISPSTDGYTANSTVKIYGNIIDKLDVTSKGLTSLDLSNISLLISLYCGNNKLTTLDVSNNPSLYFLYCDDNKLNSLDVSNNAELQYLTCNNNNLSALELNNNSKLVQLKCSNNKLSKLVLTNASMYSLHYDNNMLSIATFPRAKLGGSNDNIFCAPQAPLPISCTNGVVDLSAHYSVLQNGTFGGPLITEYTWYKTDGTLLVENTDYINEFGVFKFLKKPSTEVYCTMTNAFYPQLSGTNALRTTDITIDAVAEPNISFVSENSGSLSFTSNYYSDIFVDWGDGNIISNQNTGITPISTPSYTKGTTVKIYSNQIIALNVSNQNLSALKVDKNPILNELNCSNNSLTALDLSNSPALVKLKCQTNNLATLNTSSNSLLTWLECSGNPLLNTLNLSSNTALNKLFASDCSLSAMDISTASLLESVLINGNKLSFASLPQAKASYASNYIYSPQANLAATCTNALVDLSSQLTAKDKDNNIHPTVYTWYTTEDVLLTKGIDYLEGNGVFYFIKQPATDVYCLMANTAFPALTLRTENITVNAVVEPSVTFTSNKNGAFSFMVRTTLPGQLKIDLGNGNLVNCTTTTIMATVTTSAYVAGSTIKIFGDHIDELSLDNLELTSLNVSRSPDLRFLKCNTNTLTSIDVSQNTKLSYLDCSANQIENLDISKNTALTSLACSQNKLQLLDVSQNTLLQMLMCILNNLSTLDISKNTALEILNCSLNKLSVLDVSKNTGLRELICYSNQLDFVTLPRLKSNYTSYYYQPQANIKALCTSGVVDLSAQLTAIDKDGKTQTTVYTWYYLNGNLLTNYREDNGVFKFAVNAGTEVYCTMTNAAFPGLTLLNENTIDAKATLPVVWTGATNNDWHTASNWSSNTVPSTEDVVIPVGASNYPTISTDAASFNSLTLKSDATGTATLIALKGLSGNVKVEQYITGHTNVATNNPNGRFWYLSSPLLDAKSNVFNAAAANNKLWPYAETAHNYVEINDNTTALEVGRGYCVRVGTTGSVVFKGNINTANTTIIATYANDDHLKQGFNLVGNPYTAFLDWNSGSLTKTNLVNSYWLRGFNGTAMVFDTYISGVGTSLSGTPMDGKIAPMQAFWVKADGQNGSLDISPLALTHSGQKLVKGGTVDERPILRLKVSNGTQADEAIVLFDQKATNSFDNQYDAPKLSNDDAAIPEIFTLSGTREIVINSLKDVATNKEVALGFRTGKAGKFTIKASEIKNFSQAVSLILEDKLTGIKQNLSQTPAYAFSSEVATVNDRFVLHFAESTTGIDEVGESTKVNVWLGADNQLNVELGKADGKSRIQIYTPLGQQLLAKEFAGTQTQLTLNYQPGVYLVSVICGNQKTTRKIVVQ
jgi:Leucine-rich repeat (LRR) protein